jgi:hypothetical protein
MIPKDFFWFMLPKAFLKSIEIFRLLKVKVKQSLNRPGVAQMVPGVLGSHIS